VIRAPSGGSGTVQTRNDLFRSRSECHTVHRPSRPAGTDLLPEATLSDVLITVCSDEASDSWGFVGVVTVGDLEAYRTLEVFPAPAGARSAAEEVLATALGELLAGAEWRRLRESKGSPPTRRDLALGVLDSSADTFGASPDDGGDDTEVQA
jgi:hypothetical protein